MNETLVGLYVGAVTNLLVVAVLNNPPFWEGTADVSIWLITLGTWNEVLGVLLVASPELLPRLGRVGRLLLGRFRAARLRLLSTARRVLRLPGSAYADSATVGARLSVSGHAVHILGPPATTDHGELLAWLIKREKWAQERFQEIEKSVSELPERWRADMGVMREELEGVSRKLVREAADARIRLRLLGLGYVVLGLILSWAGNLV